MTSQDDRKERLAELQDLLDTWGGEPVRWPPKVRLRIAELLVLGPPARQIVERAGALDRLLDLTQDRPPAAAAARTGALADRIMAAAVATPAPVTGATPSAEIIELPRRQPAVVAAPSALKSARVLPAINGRRWHTAGLLAASLLAGIYIGGSVNVGPVFQELVEAVGLSQGADGPATGLGDDLDDEEAL